MKSIRYFLLPKISSLICQAALFAYRCYGNRDDRHGQNTERLTVLLLTLLWLFVLFASFRFFVFFFFFVIFLFFAKETFSSLFSISRSIVFILHTTPHLLILRILQGIFGCLLNLYVMFPSGPMDTRGETVFLSNVAI